MNKASERMKQLNTKHGFARRKHRIRTYRIWCSMRQRCNNAKSKDYLYYGAKGISVDPRWDDFKNFLNDMGECPSDRHSIDRFPDKCGNYELSNCRWATYEEQNSNRSNCKLITYKDRTQTLSAWARELGFRQPVLHRRIFVYKWSVEKAFTSRRYPKECMGCGYKWNSYIQNPKKCRKCSRPVLI